MCRDPSVDSFGVILSVDKGAESCVVSVRRSRFDEGKGFRSVEQSSFWDRVSGDCEPFLFSNDSVKCFFTYVYIYFFVAFDLPCRRPLRHSNALWDDWRCPGRLP